jgi:hypothetical protein
MLRQAQHERRDVNALVDSVRTERYVVDGSAGSVRMEIDAVDVLRQVQRGRREESVLAALKTR